MWSVNVGWRDYLKEQIQEFHDIPLQFEPQSKVTLLTIYVSLQISCILPSTFHSDNFVAFANFLIRTFYLQVPDWLSGTYVRNGPARLSFESERNVYFFAVKIFLFLKFFFKN